MIFLSDPVIFDIESYPNYFLIIFKRYGKEGFRVHETSESFGKDEIGSLREFCSRSSLIGYFSSGYDMPMLAAALRGAKAETLKKLSDRIIRSRIPAWRIMKEYGLEEPACRLHVDLAQSVGPFPPSLKTLACRIGYDRVWELPYAPDRVLTDDEKSVVKKYCLNDIGVTEAVADLDDVRKTVRSRVRAAGTRDEPFDWINGGDVRLGEQMIRHRTGVSTFRDTRPPETGKCRIPSWVWFSDPELDDMAGFVRGHEFRCPDAKVLLPPELNREVGMGPMVCKFGIGGIHSTGKGIYAEEKDGVRVCEVDVSSYYPNLIVSLGIEPPRLDGRFGRVFRDLLAERLEAKESGDDTNAAILKLVINSAYGKFNSSHSVLYDPYALGSVVFSGQFGMLHLAERFLEAGITPMATNTDSVTCIYPDTLEERFRAVCDDWCGLTGLVLDRTPIRGIWYRDINNYLAVLDDGRIRGKGIFGPPGPAKAPYPRCITGAVSGYLKDGIPIVESVRSTWEPGDFVLSRNIKAGGIWKDKDLGKNPRWVWEKGSQYHIRYRSNGNKVPYSDGCRPLMDLRDDFTPDFPRYIHAAEKLLESITVERMC